MKKIFLFFILPFTMFAQHFQMNDPNPSSSVITEINFQVDKYYPIFGISEKPFTSEKIFRLTDIEGVYTAYLHFTDKYNPPRSDTRSKTLHFYFDESTYNYINIRLDKDAAYVIYREYKDGHKWGEIYFDKYP